MSGRLSCGPGLVDGVAEIAACREGQERLDARAGQGEDIAAGKAALGRRARCRAADGGGQAVEIALVERELPGLLVMEHILAEEGVQRRQPRGERRHARLLLGRQQGAAAYEAEMRALEEPCLIGGETQRIAPRVEIGNAGVQERIERDRNVMLGEARRVVPRDGLERVIRVAAAEVEEGAADPREQAAAALHGLDGVGEARWLAGRRDRRDLRLLLGHAAVESRREMLRAEAVEGRKAERRGPGREEGVVGHAAAARSPTSNQIWMLPVPRAFSYSESAMPEARQRRPPSAPTI
jgi:hypothetical protein